MMSVVGLHFVVADLIERLVVVPLVRLRPGSRDRILLGWLNFNRELFFRIFEGIGGGRVSTNVSVPDEPGRLIVMNHQSLMDIPIALRFVPGGYPRIVARMRYARGVPMISHTLRLYGHPIVTPGVNKRRQLQKLECVARTSQFPIAIFPEGHRTRDGEIRRFKTAGLKTILKVRPWKVHAVVVDGVWRHAEFKDLLRDVSTIRARAESAGTFSFDPERDDDDAFIDTLRQCMCDKLAEMRRSEPEGSDVGV